MDEIKYELIKRAMTGNALALQNLIKSEQKNIYSMLFYLKKDESDILDIAQNILIKLTRKISQLKNPLSYKTWLNQIVLNTYYDYLRKNQKNAQVVSLVQNAKDDETIFDIPDDTFNPQNFILNTEMDNVIKKSIQNLPSHYKIPLTLREIQGLSYDEISNITKTSIGTVKSRISRARNIVQSEIEKYAKN